MSAPIDNVARSIRVLAEPDPYRANPFRVLGLSPLANARETSRRIEGLRVAAELGEAPSDWAFAPAGAPSPDAIRAAAQTLRDPLSRFLCEFFWFWPLAYPAATPDPGLLALATGDTDTATRLWSEAPADSVAAVHNLAVYQHVLALEWENDPAIDPAQLADVRASATELWRRTLEARELPALLAARLHELADPHLPASLSTAIPAIVPEALARAHLRLALRQAESDRLDDAAAHLRLAERLLDAPGALPPLVAEAAAPLVQRLQAGLKSSVAPDISALDYATALLRSAAPDLARIQTLLGRPAPVVRAAVRSLDLVLLDAVIAHQRSGGAEHLVLPHLLYLLDQATSPELAQRLVSTFEVMSANALLAARPAELAPETDFAALDRELALRLILDHLAPAGAEVLALPPADLRSYQARLAAWIVALANEAVATGLPEGEAWARRHLAAALEHHAVGTLAAGRLSSALARLDLAKGLAISLAGPANTFSVDHAGIALDGQLIAPGELTALRHGPDRSPDGDGRLLLAWSSAQHAHALYLDQLQDPESPDPELPRRIHEAIDYFLIPPLVARIDTALRSGKRVIIGPLTFTQAGIQAETHHLLGNKTHLISYARARAETEADGKFVVTDPAQPHPHEPIDPAATWNALLIPHLIAHFAPPTHGRSA